MSGGAGGRVPAREPTTLVVPRFALESGEVLRDVAVAYHLDGPRESVADDCVLVFHALTGDADAAGGWWRDVVGPGRAIDTTRRAVLCANLLGSCYGTTGAAGPGTRCGADFPAVTTRDMARLVGHVVDHVGVRVLALVVGGSLGGMVALEWALLHPGRARSLVVLAAPAAHPAWALGWSAVQRRALALGRAAGDPAAGLALARMIAMLGYRTADEFEVRFDRAPAAPARTDAAWAAEAYLAHHGDRLVARFDPDAYRTLLDAMDAHDVGRGRGGLDAALAALRDAVPHVVGVGIPGDVLYPPADVRRWTDAAGAEYRELHSIHGHDAFLLEAAQVTRVVHDALAASDALTLTSVSSCP